MLIKFDDSQDKLGAYFYYLFLLFGTKEIYLHRLVLAKSKYFNKFHQAKLKRNVLEIDCCFIKYLPNAGIFYFLDNRCTSQISPSSSMTVKERLS